MKYLKRFEKLESHCDKFWKVDGDINLLGPELIEIGCTDNEIEHFIRIAKAKDLHLSTFFINRYCSHPKNKWGRSSGWNPDNSNSDEEDENGYLWFINHGFEYMGNVIASEKSKEIWFLRRGIEKFNI